MAIATNQTPREVIRPTIRHWKDQIAATKAQIASGKFPEFDKNCRRYIRECEGYIKTLNALMDHPRFLGKINPNHIINGTVDARPGDTFLDETHKGGFLAYRYQPGCRTGQGVWNDFLLLARGTHQTCLDALAAA